MADSADRAKMEAHGMGKLVDALKFLADEPKLLALVMIVLAVAMVVLGVVARPTAERNDLTITLSALFIILVIGGVVSVAFLTGETSRKSTETTRSGVSHKDVAYANSTLLAKERVPTRRRKSVGEGPETEPPAAVTSKPISR